MKAALILLILTWQYSETYSQICSRPIVKRRQVYIYKSITQISTQVMRCLYNDTKISYSDISDNCISAFVSGKFTNKYDDTYNLKTGNAPVVLEEYPTPADPLKNIIVLRSGTLCRYDRGFCYDSRETHSYAAVWTALPVPKEKCSHKLEIFNGFADIWTFKPKNLTYLFYYDSDPKRSFALKLLDSTVCFNKELWYTDERGYMVSFTSLGKSHRPITKPSQQYFSLKSREFVAEAILKDCDLKTDYLDFDTQINAKYLVDAENLKTVLKLYQNSIDINRQSLEVVGTEITRIENDVFYNLTSKSSFQGQSNDLNGPTNKVVTDLSAKSKEFALLINGLKLRDEELFLFIERIRGNITDLKRSINSTDQIKQHFEQLFLNFRHEMDDKFEHILNDNKNKSIENANVEKLILKKLSPILESINNTCLLKINTLRQDISQMTHVLEEETKKYILSKEKDLKTTLHNLSTSVLDEINETKLKIKAIENQLQDAKINNDRNSISLVKDISDARKNITFYFQTLHNRSSTIEDNVKIKFDQFTTLMNSKSDISLNEMANIRSNITEIITTLDKKIRQNHLDLSDTVGKKIVASENSISQLINTFDSLKKNCEKTRNYTDLKLKEIEENIKNLLVLNKSDLEEDLLKKFNTAFGEVTQKSNTCIKDVNELKASFEKSKNILKEELSHKITDFKDSFKQIEKDNINLANKINLTVSSIEDTNNRIKQLNTVLNITNKDINVNRGRLEKVESSVTDIRSNIDALLKSVNDNRNIKDLKNNVNETVYTLKEDISKRFILENENLTKYIRAVNNSLFKEVVLLDKRVDDLENNASFLINNLQSKVEDGVFNKVNPLISLVDQKCTKYGEKTKELQENTAKDINNLRKEIIQNILNKTKTVLENITEFNTTLIEKVNGLKGEANVLQGNLQKNSLKVLDLDTQIKDIYKRAQITHDTAFSNKDTVSNLDQRINNLTTVMANIKVDIRKNGDNQEVFNKINKSLENNSDMLKKLKDTIDTTNTNAERISVQAKDFNVRLDMLSRSIKDTEDNVKRLQKQAEENSNLSKDIVELKQELNKANNFLKINAKKIEVLSDHVSACENSQNKSSKVIEGLKNEIDSIKSNFQHKDILLLNVQKQLEKKDEEITEIKAQLQSLLSCCTKNSNRIKDNDDAIKQLNNTFINTKKIFENEHKIFNSSINKLLGDDVDVPVF